VGRIEEMTFTTPENRFKEIRRDDEHFMMTDGIKLVPRAGIEISKYCPREYQLILADCIDRGWVKPVAYVKTKELFWEAFHK
jgi:hypothetical protein